MNPPPVSLRFRRSNRIKLGRDFLRIKTQGERAVCGCLIANWTRLAENTPIRLGVITSKKIGNAVIRSRARRLLRETFRLHQHDFIQPVELILVARQSIVKNSRAEVEKDFLQALRRGGILKKEF